MHYRTCTTCNRDGLAEENCASGAKKKLVGHAMALAVLRRIVLAFVLIMCMGN